MCDPNCMTIDFSYECFHRHPVQMKGHSIASYRPHHRLTHLAKDSDIDFNGNIPGCNFLIKQDRLCFFPTYFYNWNDETGYDQNQMFHGEGNVFNMLVSTQGWTMCFFMRKNTFKITFCLFKKIHRVSSIW